MFTVNRQVLEAELALLQSVAERKTTIPVLSMVLFDVSKGKANLTATDLDVTIKTSVGVSECDDWAFCVPAKQLYSLVRLFNGETIAFGVEGGRVKIQCENSKHFLPMMGKSVPLRLTLLPQKARRRSCKTYLEKPPPLTRCFLFS